MTNVPINVLLIIKGITFISHRRSIVTLIAVQNTQNSTLNPLPPRTIFLVVEHVGSWFLVAFLITINSNAL